MDPTSPPSWITPQNALGVAIVAVLALIAGAREAWVYGRIYRRALAEADAWKASATDNLRLAETQQALAKAGNEKLDRVLALLERTESTLR